jgi:hypothetical protein
MKPVTRLALLGSLVAGLTLSLGGWARADHELGHDHPFCAQGGGQAGDSSGGPGGTIPPEGALTETDSGAEVPKTILIPRHLAARFGEDDPDPRGVDADAQFIEIGAKALEDVGGTGSSGGPFHGGHGGGPGGGQGGSTFFGAGDGGCTPEFVPTRGRPVPGRRLPVTGTSAEQFALMGGVFLIVGGTFVFAPQIVSAVNGFLSAVFRRPRERTQAAPAEAEGPPHQAPVVQALEAPVSDAAHHHESGEWEAAVEGQRSHGGGAVARLREEIGSSWGGSGGGAGEE